MCDVLRAASDTIEAQRAVIDKLRQVTIGLQQDLDSAAGPHTSEERRAMLGAAIEACRDRIDVEAAVLAKLRRLHQGLIVDLAWRGTGPEGSNDGVESGTV